MQKIAGMKIAVWGNLALFEELSTGPVNIDWERPASWQAFLGSDAEVLINLDEKAAEADYSEAGAPVIINSVVRTLSDSKQHEKVIRINGWPGFLKRTVWEFAGTESEAHKKAFEFLGKQATRVPDQPGFIAARIICMIINEAFYARGEEVSTEPDIDIAMKLGTNYPLGPFEWVAQIGIEKVYSLLSALSATDQKYKPSPLLSREAMGT